MVGVRGVAWAALGLGLVAACSDDEGPSGTDVPSGAGGEGGDAQPSRGGGGKGGGTDSLPTAGTSNAGSATEGGAAGASAGAAGEAGVGGVAPVPIGIQCSSCGETECEDVLERCGDSPACREWLSCLKACVEGPCVDACDAAHVEVSRAYTGVYACLCNSCSDDCAPARACEKQECVDAEAIAPQEVPPATLAETGLFELDGAGGEGAGGAGGASGGSSLPLSRGVRTYEPRYPLWSDGATKQRYIYVPKCETIDTTDMDHWKFPVGTRLWKTFAVGGAAVETRLLHRFGAGPSDWAYAAYQWDPSAPNDPTLATKVADTGVANANGTSHDIPSLAQCRQCHNGLPEKVLGFSAFQLSHDAHGADLSIERVSDWGWLSEPAREGFEVPGNAVQKAALGYMHGNCGNCHSDSTPTPGGDPQILRLSVHQLDYAETDSVKTTVGISTMNAKPALAGKPRIDPQSPSTSTVLMRMENRSDYPMPPVGSKLADTAGGVADVTAWINSIPKP